MKRRQGFRYRIYPTPEQVSRLESWQGALRFLWNLAHEQRLTGLARERRERRYPSAFAQINELKGIREELDWLADVPRNVCAQLLVELDKSWQRCFRKLARQPRWKRKGRDWAPLCEPHPKVWRLDAEGSRLRFPKLGWTPVKLHRALEGTPKTCTITREHDQWFVSIVCEREVEAPAPPAGAPVALDRGVAVAVADSDGRMVQNPRFLRKQAKRLARAQRVVARRRKGSENQKKARAKVARLHRKVRRQREHFLHHVSNDYAKNHGIVVVEKLLVRNMTRSAKGTREAPGNHVRAKAGLNKAILDVGWGRLCQMLRYKCDWSGATLFEVAPNYSSQTCAACSFVAKQSRRSQSQFVCVACRHVANADVNAAEVLLSRGIHGGAVCGGSAVVRRPAKQKLRVARRGTRLKTSRPPKASSFTAG